MWFLIFCELNLELFAKLGRRVIMSDLTDKFENVSLNETSISKPPYFKETIKSVNDDTSSTVSGKSSISSASSAQKTPVSLLQELYVRKGITPKYDLVQIEGLLWKILNLFVLFSRKKCAWGKKIFNFYFFMWN